LQIGHEVFLVTPCGYNIQHCCCFQDDPSGYFSDDSDEDIAEELKKDFVDENVGDTVTNK
jgi:hypothetical protein